MNVGVSVRSVNRENDRTKKIIDRIEVRLYERGMEQNPTKPKRVGRPPGRRFTDRFEVKIKPADLTAFDEVASRSGMLRAEAIRSLMATAVKRGSIE